MQSITFSNLFLCAPEADFTLDQLNLFNQADKENTEKMRGCASALFDSQTIARSTRQGKTFIERKTLSICVGLTMNRIGPIYYYISIKM